MRRTRSAREIEGERKRLACTYASQGEIWALVVRARMCPFKPFFSPKAGGPYMRWVLCAIGPTHNELYFSQPAKHRLSYFLLSKKVKYPCVRASACFPSKEKGSLARINILYLWGACVRERRTVPASFELQFCLLV